MTAAHLAQDTMEKASDTEQMTSFCSAVYPGVIFCECGQVELALLLSSGGGGFFGLFWWGRDGLKPQEEKCDICLQYFAFVL